jgi:hypothetical protein
MKLIRLIKMCLNVYIHIDKHLSDCFPAQNDPKHLEYAIKKSPEIQEGLKLNETHQLLAYADDVNLLGYVIIRKYTETLISVNWEVGKEINVEKTSLLVGWFISQLVRRSFGQFCLVCFGWLSGR